MVSVVASWFWNMPPSVGYSLRQARRALAQGDNAAAESWSRKALARDSSSSEANWIAGRACLQASREDDALGYFRKVARQAPDALAARLAAGQLLLMHFHRLTEADAEFRRALELDAENLSAHEARSFTLGMAGRAWEAIPHRLELIRQNQHQRHHLYLLCTGDTTLENEALLAQCLAAAPGDRWARLGHAKILLDRQRYAEAESLLEALTREDPADSEAQSRLGRRLAESGSPEFVRWNAQLPMEAEDHPEVWAARGTWAWNHNASPVAIRCFWEALQRDPNHERANYQLGQLLQAENERQAAEAFLERSRLLTEYLIAVEQVYLGNDLSQIRTAAQKAEQLGLLWESLGWYQIAFRDLPEAAWPAEGVLRLQSQTAELDLRRTPPAHNPAGQVDLSPFPLPSWNNVPDVTPLPIEKTAPMPPLRFEDVAPELGIAFQYFNGAPRDEQTHRMYEFTGGGAAAMDFDQDGWTDIYFSQGAEWPPSSQQDHHLDRLFRNQGDRFIDVTESAGIREGGYSQGVAVGDYDSDGFCDFYVANIGANAFFRNNGDGTFSEMFDAAGAAGNQWTTSCLLADLNGDRLADLYCVNYLSGKDIYERTCLEDDGSPRSCSPRFFEGSQDQFFLNLGDGAFRRVTSTAGIEVPNGKGLGVVAADFDGSGRLSLFVANDGMPNFFFLNQTSTPGAAPQFAEQGLAFGLAVDIDGRPQACMGVAAGDANGDGLLDLFVSNFFNEFNTLYRQQASCVFADETHSAGLAEPSLKFLGFGTQFVDGELDGLPDLIVANGDVDDFTHTGRPYAMLPQYFRNAGGGRFTEIAGAEAGPYFTKSYLGRGLVRIDWDRDGREDVIISHLDVPAALVANRTTGVGHYLQVRLVGTESERSAIGTTVTIWADGTSWVQQLTAGDGYLASNERLLTFGLGTVRQIDRMAIQWPTGTREEFTAVDSNQTVLCVEGQGRLLPIVVDR